MKLNILINEITAAVGVARTRDWHAHTECESEALTTAPRLPESDILD